MKKLYLASLLMVLIAKVGFSADTIRVVRSDILTKTSSPIVTNLFFSPVSLDPEEVTINAALGDVFITGLNQSATAIGAITNATAGQVITLIGNPSATDNASTIADSGNFKIAGAFTVSPNCSIQLYMQSASNFVELSRSTN